MRLAAQHIHDARGWIGTPVELEHEVRCVSNDADAKRLQQAIALCWLTAVASAPIVAPEPLALEHWLREMEAAYGRIGYVREAADRGDIGDARARLADAADYDGCGSVEPLWSDDAGRLAIDLRQRGYDVEVGRSDGNCWDVSGLYYVRATAPTDD